MKSRKTLCSALIQCHLDYASCCWYEGLTKKLKHKLQVAQNKVVRFILKLPNRQSVGLKEFEEVGFLPVFMRVRQLRLNHVHNIYHQKCPSYLSHNFNSNFSLRNPHNTRSGSSSFYIPYIKGVEASTFFTVASKTGMAFQHPFIIYTTEPNLSQR